MLPSAALPLLNNVYAGMRARCCPQITAPKPVPWTIILRLLLAWGIEVFVLVTSTQSNSRRLFFFTYNVHFLLWVPAVSGINFQNKENGLCSWGRGSGAFLNQTQLVEGGNIVHTLPLLFCPRRRPVWKESDIILPRHLLTEWVGSRVCENPVGGRWPLWSPVFCVRWE